MTTDHIGTTTISSKCQGVSFRHTGFHFFNNYIKVALFIMRGLEDYGAEKHS